MKEEQVKKPVVDLTVGPSVGPSTEQQGMPPKDVAKLRRWAQWLIGESGYASLGHNLMDYVSAWEADLSLLEAARKEREQFREGMLVALRLKEAALTRLGEVERETLGKAAKACEELSYSQAYHLDPSGAWCGGANAATRNCVTAIRALLPHDEKA